MSPSLLAVLLVYLATLAVAHGLTLANLRHLHRRGHVVPTPFAGYIDPEVLEKTRGYTVDRGRVDLAASLLSGVLTILVLFGGVLNWFNNLIAGLGFPPIGQALLFFLLMHLAATIVNLPFSLFSTFRVERKYGFNRQTAGLWWTDQVKSLAISLVLYGLLILIVFSLIQALPQSWWLVAWLAVLGLTILLLYISPYVIEPLFNTFKPVADDELVGEIRQVLAKAGISISRVFAMDASKRSGHSNAYFSGIGRVKRIVLFDTLLAGHERREIIAILAHEAGHWKKKHLLKMLFLMQTISLAGFYAAHRVMAGHGAATLFDLDRATPQAELLLLAFLGGLLLFPLRPLASALSRYHERQADRFALALTGDGRPLAAALIKLGKDNLANLHPHPWYAAFYYSHPPLVQRVESLLKGEEQSPPGRQAEQGAE